MGLFITPAHMTPPNPVGGPVDQAVVPVCNHSTVTPVHLFVHWRELRRNARG